MDKTPDSIKQYLTRDQYRLYELIWRRFLASQAESAVYDTVQVKIASTDQRPCSAFQDDAEVSGF